MPLIMEDLDPNRPIWAIGIGALQNVGYLKMTHIGFTLIE